MNSSDKLKAVLRVVAPALLGALLVLAGLAIHSLAPESYAQGAAKPGSAAGPETTQNALASLPRLGLQSYWLTETQALDNIGGSGAGFVRTDFDWASIEPVLTDPPTYNWSNFDTVFGSLASRNMVIMGTVVDIPAWAGPQYTGPISDTNLPAFTAFMSAAAARYSQAPYNVHFWEMFNEPDGAGGPSRQFGWGLHPDKYTLMLSQVYPAVKAADAQAVVLNGGLAYDNWFEQGGPFNPNFLPDILSDGAAAYTDALNFHYYQNNAHGWSTIGLKTDAIQSVLTAHNVTLPMISTEAGTSSDPAFGGSEQSQARYVVQVNAQAAAAHLLANVWFLNRDFANIPAQYFTHFGLTRVDNSTKPAYTAMQVLGGEIGSGPFIRKMDSTDGVPDGSSLEGYRFWSSMGNHERSVIWNNTASSQTLVVGQTQAGDLVRAADIYSQTIATTPDPSGGVQVQVGQDPVYLEWCGRFEDVPCSLWAYNYVEYLASHGIISGYGNGTFRPNAQSTRGQFSKMIVLGMGWTIATPPQPTFNDVPADSPFYQYVETSYAHGVLGGYVCGGVGEPCPGNYFRPGANITRGQIAKIVVLAKGWILANPSEATFEDVPVGSTFFAQVETAVSHGVISGYACGGEGEPCNPPGNKPYFRPGANATRAQLSKMLSVALQQP